MPVMTWTSGFSVNIKEIDEQHKKLISILNSLYDAMKTGRGKEIVRDVFDELVDYVGRHFKIEEDYFARYGYPEAEHHAGEHDALRKKLADLKMKFDGGSSTISIELMNFLVSWVENHILKVDKQYSSYLNSKGLS